jgi:hypothetical protein
VHAPAFVKLSFPWAIRMCKHSVEVLLRRDGMQSHCSMALIAQLPLFDFKVKFVERLAVWLPPGLLVHVEAGRLADALRKAPSEARAGAFKTWCHGWTTSYRMHGESLHACVFGCPGGASIDAMSHYAVCEPLRDAMIEATGETRCSEALFRFGLSPPAPVLAAVAFKLYNVIAKNRDILNSAQHFAEVAEVAWKDLKPVPCSRGSRSRVSFVQGGGDVAPLHSASGSAVSVDAVPESPRVDRCFMTQAPR